MAALTEIIFDIATAPSRKSKMWKNTKISCAGLVKKLETPIRTGETVAEYFAMKKVERDKRKDQGGFVSGYLEGGIRKKGSVKHRQLVCLDVDNIKSGTDFLELAEAALYSRRRYLKPCRHKTSRPGLHYGDMVLAF